MSIVALSAASDVDKDGIPVPKLVNNVATFCVIDSEATPGRKINLARLAMMATPRIEFNVKRFAAVIMRMRTPKTTCLVFASGKCVCTGARTEEEANLAAVEYVRIMQASDIHPDFHSFNIENHVASVDCKFKLDLVKLSQSVSGWVAYEHNIFPGFVFRETDADENGNKQNTVAILCFQSGKCVVTGKRDRAAIFTTWKRFYLSALLPNRAVVDHGSSSNYRTAQHHDLSRASRDNHLTRMTRAVTPLDRSTLLNKSDLDQMELSRPAALVAIQQVVDYVANLSLFDDTPLHEFQPGPPRKKPRQHN